MSSDGAAEQQFIHLRSHTAYSLAEGAIKVKELIDLCLKHELPAIGVVDSGNLFGALEIAVAASKAGIQPITGVQLNLRREEEKTEGGGLKVVAGTAHIAPDPDQIVLLAQSEVGYRNLLHLVSTAFLESHPSEAPQVSIEAMDGHAEGLIALTGGPKGTVGRLLLDGDAAGAEAFLLRLKALFGDRLYIELHRHFQDDERRIEGGLLDLAHANDVPIVAVNECFFAGEEMHEAHEVLLGIAEGKTVSQTDRRRVSLHNRFKSPAEMIELFADLPEAIENTVHIARRCAYMPTTLDPILPPYASESGRQEPEELRAQAEAGLARRLEAHVYTAEMDETARAEAAKPYHDRLDMELGVINNMGFPGYFLIVADFIQWAKAQDIPVGPGRGSGAGSVVAWALTITDLDPLRWGLLFERFLNPERVSMPDFDIDFCQDRRDEVIDYVQNKYGRDRVAQIITFGKLQARAVLRDVGRVLEMPYGQVDRICKLVPNNPANPVTLAQAIEGEPELRRQRDEDEQVGTLIRIGLRLEGLYRHASTHAAGVVIGDRPLEELIPLYRDPRSDMPVTQFNMKWVEPAGLVKFDFLGLKTLSVLQKAVDILAKRGIEIDLSALPLDDKPTYEMIGKGDTVGVFQLESTGMRDVLRRMKADRFEDIIALVALYRPGPMANIPKYIACKHGEEEPDYMHPKLEAVLTETFGIMIYQEQVQQAAQALAGYTLGGADLLRRAMGKKIQAEMDAQRETFVKGSVDNGVDGAKASAIFDQISAFAGYGFNKSHAAAYALVAYQTAYLKANYPVEFLAASMTYDMGNTDRLSLYRQELQFQGIPLLGPDVNRSFADFAVEEVPAEAEGEEARLGIRYALGALKNVGVQAMQALTAEREENGRFQNLDDFATRLDSRMVNKRLLENLVRAGAFDALHHNRAALFESIEMLLRHASAAAEERDSNQVSLFAMEGGMAGAKIEIRDRPEWPATEQLREEFDAIGFYLSSHPLESYGPALARVSVVRSDQIESTVRAKGRDAARVNLAGMVVSYKVRTSAKGSRFAFLQMSDQAGVFEVLLFSEILATSRPLLEAGNALLVRADVRIEEGQTRMTASRVEPLDDAIQHAARGLHVFIRDPKAVEPLRSLMQGGPRGRGRIKLTAMCEGQEVDLSLPEAYKITGDFRAAIKSLPGILDVRDL